MNNILNVVFVIIGTLIGAGFASGQEMYIFFFSYGINGLIGIFISSLLMGFIIYKTLNIIKKYNITNYKEFLDVIIKTNTKKEFLSLKNIFNIVINMFILITFFIMVAGFGAYFSQTLGINFFIGSSILAALSFIIFMTSVKGLVKANVILIPISIILIIIVGILSVSGTGISTLFNIVEKFNKSNWILSSIIYCSYNSILLIPTLITLRNYIKNKKNIPIITIVSTIIIIMLSIILFFILAKVDIDISNIEMPVVYVVSKMFVVLKYLYGFVIVSSIFTTSISLGMSFLNNTCKNRKSYTQVAVIMCITSVIISQFGFSNLVNLLYPIFGYLGIIQILAMISK